MSGDQEIRRARVMLGAEALRTLIDLPDGLRIVAIHSTFDPDGFVLIVEGESLQPVDPCAESPYLDGIWERDRVVHEGKVYSRYGWQTGVVRA